MFKNFIYGIIWHIFVQGPLILVNGIFQALKFLSGNFVVELIFDKDGNYSFHNLPYAFLGILIVSVFLLAIFLSVNVAILMLKDSESFTKSLRQALANALKAMPIFLAVPLLFFIFAVAMSGFNALIPSLFGSNNGNIADALYYVGAPENHSQEAGSQNNYAPPTDVGEWNMFTTIFTVICVLVIIALMGVSVFVKVIELFFLFLISPLLVSSMIFDNGKRLMVWKEMTLSKFLAISAALFGVFIFSVLFSQIQQLINGISSKEMNINVKNILNILAIIGSAMAMNGFSAITANFVGESAGAREGLVSLGQTMKLATGFLAGGKAVGKAFNMSGKIAAKTARGVGRFAIGKKGLSSLNRMFLGRKNTGTGGKSETNLQEDAAENSANIAQETQGMGVGGLTGFVGSGLGYKWIKNKWKRHKDKKTYVDEYLKREKDAVGSDLTKVQRITAKTDAKQIFKSGDEKLMHNEEARQYGVSAETYAEAKDIYPHKNEKGYESIRNFKSAKDYAIYIEKVKSNRQVRAENDARKAKVDDYMRG